MASTIACLVRLASHPESRVRGNVGLNQRFLKIALVVGTLLCLINQGERLQHGEEVSWIQLLMNYLVPYFVASYSAAKNETGRGIDDKRAEIAKRIEQSK